MADPVNYFAADKRANHLSTTHPTYLRHIPLSYTTPRLTMAHPS